MMIQVWTVLTSWKQSFDSEKEASVPETNEFKLKLQFGKEASI